MPEPVKIARIITRFGVGGVERHVSTLTANLDRTRFKSWLITGRTEPHEHEWLELAAQAGVTPLVVQRMRRRPSLWDVSASFSLHSILSRIRPQIVETHQSKAGVLGRLVSRLRCGPSQSKPLLIHTFHGHQFQGYFTSSLSRAFVAIERCLARFTDLIITVTPTIRNQLISEYRIAPADKIRVVPLGFDFSWTEDLPQSRGWLRSRVHAKESTILCGTVCRLTEIKNIAFLLRAFAKCLNRKPVDLHLVIVGDGELRESLESLAAELNISRHVTFTGIVHDRARIFADLDVTCLTSRNEGSPLCLIESIAAGVPVVATKVGGVADVVLCPVDGELVQPYDEEAFAAALGRMATSCRRLPDERSYALKTHYSIPRLIRNMESIYEELLEQRGLQYRLAEAHTA